MSCIKVMSSGFLIRNSVAILPSFFFIDGDEEPHQVFSEWLMACGVDEITAHRI
jgi:hypothetical protein